MSERNRNRTRKAPKSKLELQPETAAVPKRVKTAFLVVIVCGLLVSVLAFAVVGNTRTGENSSASIAGPNFSFTAHKGDFVQPASLKELLDLSEKDLPKVDLVVMNLLCAEGLPGTEKLNVTKCSALLDKWAEKIKSETDRHLYRFRQAPQEYENSEGFFRILMLNTILQQDFGVHYNLERMREIDFSNSKDLFIHGMIQDENGGTCASMPVLVTAVARRLGYPVRIVTAKAHLFCRWDAPGDRINLEVSGRGLNTYPDEHYKTWPMPTTEVEIKANRFLISLSPKEELANFLEDRGHCLVGNKRFAEAEAVFARDLALCPEMDRYQAFLAEARNKREIAENSGWQKFEPAQQNVPESIEILEYNRRMRRYSAENPVANPDPYASTAGQDPNAFGNPANPIPPSGPNMPRQLRTGPRVPQNNALKKPSRMDERIPR